LVAEFINCHGKVFPITLKPFLTYQSQIVNEHGLQASICTAPRIQLVSIAKLLQWPKRCMHCLWLNLREKK